MYNQNPPPTPPPGYFGNNPFPPPPQEPPQNSMDLFKIVGINLGIFAAYQALLVMIASEAFLILDMFPLMLHWLVMLVLMIVGFSRRKKYHGLGHLISLIVIVIIGFGSCWWIADAVGSGY